MRWILHRFHQKYPWRCARNLFVSFCLLDRIPGCRQRLMPRWAVAISCWVKNKSKKERCQDHNRVIKMSRLIQDDCVPVCLPCVSPLMFFSDTFTFCPLLWPKLPPFLATNFQSSQVPLETRNLSGGHFYPIIVFLFNGFFYWLKTKAPWRVLLETGLCTELMWKLSMLCDTAYACILTLSSDEAFSSHCSIKSSMQRFKSGDICKKWSSSLTQFFPRVCWWYFL